MKKILFSVLLAAIGFSACNKEKSAMRRLDGDWRLVRVDVSANSQDITNDLPAGTIFSFTRCSDAWCPLQLVAADGSASENMAYDISSDGSQIIIAETSLNPAADQQSMGTIDELTRSRFVFTLDEELNGETIEMTYTLEAE